MKELNYKPCNANTMKIKHAKRKQTLGRVLLFVFVLFAGIGLANADFSKMDKGAAIGSGISLATVLPFMVGGKFKELKGEELETFMKDAQPEDIANYQEQLYNVRKEALDKAIADKVSKEDLQKAQDEFAKTMNERFDALQKALQAQGIALSKMVEQGGNKGAAKTLVEQVKENLADLKAIAKDASSKEITLTGFKALTDRSDIANNQQAFDLMDIGQLAHRKSPSV